MPTLDELLSLDLLTLREHTELAGDSLDAQTQADRIRESLKISKVCAVRRDDALVAYAMLSPMDHPSSWFVRAFNTHPAHRSAPVMRDLFRAVAEVVTHEGIADLRSHVYKTNRLSMAFHRKLGFQVTKENAKGVEFFATVAQLAASKVLGRTVDAMRGDE